MITTIIEYNPILKQFHSFYHNNLVGNGVTLGPVERVEWWCLQCGAAPVEPRSQDSARSSSARWCLVALDLVTRWILWDVFVECWEILMEMLNCMFVVWIIHDLEFWHGHTYINVRGYPLVRRNLTVAKHDQHRSTLILFIQKPSGLWGSKMLWPHLLWHPTSPRTSEATVAKGTVRAQLLDLWPEFGAEPEFGCGVSTQIHGSL